MGKKQVWFLTTCVFLFLSLASRIHSQGQNQYLKENDLITRLPGQPSVNFKQYGGYVALDESTGRHLYYYFVEAINANASTPLVIWFNGGPGCSSLVGAFIEHGPFRIHSDGKTLYRNPYSWNNEANVLYLESPATVGFSYTNVATDEYRNKFAENGDKMTAEDNYSFLVKWLEKFPEYKGREFYIAGQSYAGHYGPQLAQIITQRNNQTFINLQGISLGNPALDRVAEEDGELEFFIGHSLRTQEGMERLARTCGQDRRSQACKDANEEYLSPTELIDPYNIYAPRCLNSTLTSEPNIHATVLNYEPCRNTYLEAYLNRADVQGAMHANTTNIPYAWSHCNGMNKKWNDKDRESSILPILSELMGAGVRILMYNGDLDGIVPFTSTRRVLNKFNQTLTKTRRMWVVDGELGGFVEEYKNNFTYATVRGAGHSVPADQPIRALTLFTSFIRNTPLPKLYSKITLPDHE